jgi:hypothetical protein
MASHHPSTTVAEGDSGDVIVNPGLKSDRDHRRRLTALQGEVAGADQMAHYAVADPNRQAPQTLFRPARGAPGYSPDVRRSSRCYVTRDASRFPARSFEVVGPVTHLVRAAVVDALELRHRCSGNR